MIGEWFRKGEGSEGVGVGVGGGWGETGCGIVYVIRIGIKDEYVYGRSSSVRATLEQDDYEEHRDWTEGGKMRKNRKGGYRRYRAEGEERGRE